MIMSRTVSQLLAFLRTVDEIVRYSAKHLSVIDRGGAPRLFYHERYIVVPLAEEEASTVILNRVRAMTQRDGAFMIRKTERRLESQFRCSRAMWPARSDFIARRTPAREGVPARASPSVVGTDNEIIAKGSGKRVARGLSSS